MAKDKETLTKKEQETLELQLATNFEAIVAISEDMEKAKALGATAREKAEAVQTGFWKSKAKAVEDLKDATITTADTTLATLDIVDKVSENQKRMADACNEFIKLGAVDLATNRAVIAFIEKTMTGGADKTLGEETVSQLQGVIRDLKQKSDLLVKQRKQGAKINEHETRLVQVEAHANDLDTEIEKSRKSEKKHDNEIKEQREKGAERDRRLDAGDKRDDTQDKQIQNLHQKNIEQDERLQQGDDYDKEQDERLKQGEEKDIEQDAVLEEQKQKDVEHDKALAEIEHRIKVLENDLEIVKNSKRTQIYIAISAGIGLIGVILGIIALVI